MKLITGGAQSELYEGFEKVRLYSTLAFTYPIPLRITMHFSLLVSQTCLTFKKRNWRRAKTTRLFMHSRKVAYLCYPIYMEVVLRALFLWGCLFSPLFCAGTSQSPDYLKTESSEDELLNSMESVESQLKSLLAQVRDMKTKMLSLRGKKRDI